MELSTCDKACEILKKTNDGDDLSPEHLYLIQEAVNEHLSEFGKQEFEKLSQSVLAGYQKPWFHGIEHMTLDHEGYVLWKGKAVEHYDSPWRWSKEGKEAAEELAERCRHLESIGVELTIGNTIWLWEKHAPVAK